MRPFLNSFRIIFSDLDNEVTHFANLFEKGFFNFLQDNLSGKRKYVEKIYELPVDVDLDGLLKRMRLKADSPAADEYRNAIDWLKDRMIPRAIVKSCSVQAFAKHMLILDGIRYQSKMLHYLLKDHQQVFLYLLTIGDTPADLHHTEHYFFQSLKLPMMFGAMKHLKKRMLEETGYASLGMANPGLVPGYPIEGSRDIFDSFGSAAQKIGLTMSKHNVMVPVFSSSGIFFEDRHHYCECSVCPIDGCIGREAAMARPEENLA
ncbi:MAG: hypothetical protein PWP30_525 [Eubacteriaceae bacterium]|nr:hypothetical protein [Eubacteriaceae bacterium]